MISLTSIFKQDILILSKNQRHLFIDKASGSLLTLLIQFTFNPNYYKSLIYGCEPQDTLIPPQEWFCH